MNCQARSFICFLLLALSLAASSKIAANTFAPPPYYAKDSFDNNHPSIDTLPVAEKNYRELQGILPIYQDAVLHPWPFVPNTQKLKYGVHNSSVPLLRARLAGSHDLVMTYDLNNHFFDDELEAAVEKFQRLHGLKVDGVVGKATLDELNVPAAVRLNQIEVNMQRWKELSPQLSDRFIMVNVPDFELYVFENNIKVLSMKAIVGKPDRQTPELTSRVTRLVFNPPWSVPPMIAKKDIVPKVLDNPDYLDEMHIRIFTRQGDPSEEVNPYEVDWSAAKENGFPYYFRQEPGMDNALGMVKFEFPNSKNVYLHDTPAKELFDQDIRTFSSGCIRLENPFELVDYLMKNDPKWDEVRMQDLLDSGRTAYVKATRPTPIFITYITAWVDENGEINFRDDVYGKDSQME